MNKQAATVEILRDLLKKDIAFLRDERAEPPNQVAIDIAANVLEKLAQKDIKVQRISTSIEGGFCLAFHSKAQMQELYLEIYNDGTLGYVIEDKRYDGVAAENKDVSIEQAIERVVRFCAPGEL